MDIQLWPIGRPKPYRQNARTWTAVAIDKVAKSIREYGFRQPIVVDIHDVITIGHLRLAAAKKLGLKQVPVHVARDLTPAQVKGLRLADNRTNQEAAWDEDLLALEIAELKNLDFDLGLTGFDIDELDELLRDPMDAARADEAPPLSDIVTTRPEDLWICGEHRVSCADSTKIEAIEGVLDGGLADMTFSDPPYSVAYTGKTARRLTIKNDDLGSGFYSFLHAACTNMLAVTKGAIYICMSSSELHTLFRAFTDAGGHWSTFVIWAKHHFTLGRSDYQRMYEPILYGWRDGTQHFWCGARDQGDVWLIDRPMANLVHPTMKPVELVERAIRNSSKSRDTVLDPFGGSGTTLIACEKSGRQARLIELEPAYVDVIVRRWEEFTDRAATLDGDGRTFTQIKAERLGSAA